jgi:hypothetical protein
VLSDSVASRTEGLLDHLSPLPMSGHLSSGFASGGDQPLETTHVFVNDKDDGTPHSKVTTQLNSDDDELPSVILAPPPDGGTKAWAQVVMGHLILIMAGATCLRLAYTNRIIQPPSLSRPRASPGLAPFRYSSSMLSGHSLEGRWTLDIITQCKQRDPFSKSSASS